MTGYCVEDPPAWVNGYVGIPWRELGRDRDGCDCWGLFRLIMAERFGVALPAYGGQGYRDRDDAPGVASLISTGLTAWIEVARRNPVTGMAPLGAERPGDGVLMRRRGLPIHVGVANVMRFADVDLQTAVDMAMEGDGADAVCVPYHPPSQRRSIEGIYRHPELRHAT